MIAYVHHVRRSPIFEKNPTPNLLEESFLRAYFTFTSGVSRSRSLFVLRSVSQLVFSP